MRAILCDDVATIEQAFGVLEGKKRYLTRKDTKDMAAMHEQGITWAEMARIYGVAESTVLRKVRKFNKEKDPSVAAKRS